ncbi:MAG: hypothetical protein IJZ46_03675 [Bacilli bacterium]|nr:hypothetical protein [Bacilli bacterium]
MNYNPYYKFIDFFKRHNLYNERVFRYIRENSTLFDYREEEYRSYISTVPVIGKDKRLKAVKLIVPHIGDDKTILINIHEYIHALLFYNKLGKYFEIGPEIEILPLFYERLYILENPTEELIKYKEFLDNIIIEENREEYIIALNSQEELHKYFTEGNTNIESLEKKSKKLSKKYKKEYSSSNKNKS